VRILRSLGATRDKSLIQRTLEFAIGVSQCDAAVYTFHNIAFEC